MSQLRKLLSATALTLASVAFAQSDFTPHINGTIRAKYEYLTTENEGRFQVRNTRVSVSGNVTPIIAYKTEIDLSVEGKISMLDAFVRFEPNQWSISLGQMRVPFTLDVHRAPHQMYFANRSFLAKQVANIRDVGAAMSVTPIKEMPWTIQGGIFNGSGITNQKDFWTKRFNFSLKTQATFLSNYTVQLGFQRNKPNDAGIVMWNAGTFFQNDRWHLEGEYLRKNYAHGAFQGVNAVNAFAVYNIPLKKLFSSLSFLGRYDYLSNHSNGIKDSSGKLVIDDPERQRLTAGINLRAGKSPRFAELRLNYEKYFYPSTASVGISDKDKIVVEVMCRF